jgi:hypothetical protein
MLAFQTQRLQLKDIPPCYAYVLTQGAHLSSSPPSMVHMASNKSVDVRRTDLLLLPGSVAMLLALP